MRHAQSPTPDLIRVLNASASLLKSRDNSGSPAATVGARWKVIATRHYCQTGCESELVARAVPPVGLELVPIEERVIFMSTV